MKIRFFAAVMLTALLLSGCSLGKEVGERAFVQLMGIEREKEIYSVTLQVYKSESGSAEADASKANSITAKGSGRTVQEALADAELSVGKELFLGHIKLLVIGKGVRNPADELSLFLDGSVSPSCPVAYSESPSAVAETLLEDGSFSAEQILSLMDSAAAQGRTVYTSVAELSASTGVLDTAAPLPIVSSDGETVSFNGVTLARKNGTAGVLSEGKVLGAKILLNQFEKGDKVTVSVNVDGSRAAAFITDACTKMKADFSDGRLKVHAEIHTKITVMENPDSISENKIENAVRREIRDRCVSAYRDSVQKNACDIFGIKKLVRRDSAEFSAYSKSEDMYLRSSVFEIILK